MPFPFWKVDGQVMNGRPMFKLSGMGDKAVADRLYEELPEVIYDKSVSLQIYTLYRSYVTYVLGYDEHCVADILTGMIPYENYVSGCNEAFLNRDHDALKLLHKNQPDWRAGAIVVGPDQCFNTEMLYYLTPDRFALLPKWVIPNGENCFAPGCSHPKTLASMLSMVNPDYTNPRRVMIVVYQRFLEHVIGIGRVDLNLVPIFLRLAVAIPDYFDLCLAIAECEPTALETVHRYMPDALRRAAQARGQLQMELCIKASSCDFMVVITEPPNDIRARYVKILAIDSQSEVTARRERAQRKINAVAAPDPRASVAAAEPVRPMHELLAEELAEEERVKQRRTRTRTQRPPAAQACVGKQRTSSSSGSDSAPPERQQTIAEIIDSARPRARATQPAAVKRVIKRMEQPPHPQVQEYILPPPTQTVQQFILPPPIAVQRRVRTPPPTPIEVAAFYTPAWRYDPYSPIDSKVLVSAQCY
jgi:hypothetical protein